MTPQEESYLLATGELPADGVPEHWRGLLDPSYSVTSADGGDLEEEDVLEVIREYAGSEAAEKFLTRYDPTPGEHPGDRVFISPVPLPPSGERYLAVSFRFGHPDPDEDRSWKARWAGIDGPFTRRELEAFDRARN